MSRQHLFGIIKQVVDKYFDFMEEIRGNQYIAEEVPDAMTDHRHLPDDEEITYWKPLPSTVTDTQLYLLEEFLGSQLPSSYKAFLQYLHFIELPLGLPRISFFKSIPDDWLDSMKEWIIGYPAELMDHGYLPIADYSDYGVVCFDSHGTTQPDVDYPLVWLDHEDNYTKPRPLAANFEELFEKLDVQLDKWIIRKRAERDN